MKKINLVLKINLNQFSMPESKSGKAFLTQNEDGFISLLSWPLLRDEAWIQG